MSAQSEQSAQCGTKRASAALLRNLTVMGERCSQQIRADRFYGAMALDISATVLQTCTNADMSFPDEPGGVSALSVA